MFEIDPDILRVDVLEYNRQEMLVKRFEEIGVGIDILGVRFIW